MNSVVEDAITVVREECDRQLSLSGLPGIILDSITDTKTGNLFRGHPLTLAALPLITFEAVGGGNPASVAAAGAAMEFLLTAGDILDDLQDGAPLPGEAGEGRDAVVRQTELVVALLLLSERSMSSLVDSGVSTSAMLRATEYFNQLKIRAFSGQFDDAHVERVSIAGPEEAMEITRRKSGSLGRAAAALGALLGSNDADAVKFSGQFGEHIGIICQLNNDIRDLWPSTGKLEDIASSKPTLPLMFAASVSGEQGAVFASGEAGSSRSRTSLAAERDRVIATGGIHFAYAHVGVELVKARRVCRQIQEKNPSSRLGELVNFN